MPREIPAPLPRTSVCSDPASAFPRPFRSAARRGETTHSCPAVFHGHRSCVRAAARSEPSAPSPHKSRAPFPTGSRYGPVADGCVLPLLLELPPPSAVPSIAGQPGGSVPQPPCVASRPSRPMAAPSGRPGFLQRPSSRAASRLAATQFDMVSSWRLSLFLGKENLLQPIKAGAESRYYLRSNGYPPTHLYGRLIIHRTYTLNIQTTSHSAIIATTRYRIHCQGVLGSVRFAMPCYTANLFL